MTEDDIYKILEQKDAEIEWLNNIICATEVERDAADEVCDNLRAEIDELKDALERSVSLQSHYAKLLNGWDEGERMQFASAEVWLNRLRYLKANHGR